MVTKLLAASFSPRCADESCRATFWCDQALKDSSKCLATRQVGHLVGLVATVFVLGVLNLAWRSRVCEFVCVINARTCGRMHVLRRDETITCYNKNRNSLPDV